MVTNEIYFLNAGEGDCIHIQFKDDAGQACNIIIDGGPGSTYRLALKRHLRAKIPSGEKIDLVVITHIDDDHIGGILAWFGDSEFDKSFVSQVWFNSGDQISKWLLKAEAIDRQLPFWPIPSNDEKISVRQGRTLENFLKSWGVWHSDPIVALQKHEIRGATLTVLSPNIQALKNLNHKWQTEMSSGKAIQIGNKSYKSISLSEAFENTDYQEDASVPNGSSIAFIFELGAFRALFAGDSHPQVLCESLRALGVSENAPIRLSLMKLSHHGSRHNTSSDLLALIRCSQFVFSTDGRKHDHPDMEVIARILKTQSNEPNPVKFLFNNSGTKVEKELAADDAAKYNFAVKVPQGDSSTLTVSIEK